MRWLAGFLVGLSIGPRASWAAEDELVVSLEPGYGMLVSSDVTQHGAGGAISGWLGLTDTLWLAASMGVLTFPERAEASAATLWEAHGGVVAALDVFRWIPYLEGLIGVVGEGGRLAPTVRLGAGVDYLITREWFVGLVLRTRPFALPIGDVNTTVSLRAGIRFQL